MKSGKTNEDYFQDRVLKLLENYVDNLEYIKNTLKGSKFDMLNKSKDIITTELDTDTIIVKDTDTNRFRPFNLKLLFIDYRTTEKEEKGKERKRLKELKKKPKK